MPATPFDSTLYAALFGDAEVANLFTDSAELRAMLVVEGALAQAQAKLGMIPAEAAEAIHRAGLETVLDPGALAHATGQNGVPVPAMVAAFRTAIGDDDAAQYAHWGATSQDIADTGLALRLVRVIDQYQIRLGWIIEALAAQAKTHRALPMAARTWGMAATPTSFGAVLASWGQPLLTHHARLAKLRPEVCAVSLSGAAGTLSAMGADGAEVRTLLAQSLGLTDPCRSTHSTREHISGFAAWITGCAGSLAKMGEDLLSLTRMGEVQLGGGGGSSTMPQKVNPVQPSAMLALCRHITGLNATLQGAAAHRDQRDGAAWMTEWLVLPQMCIALARALSLAEAMASGLTPNANAMDDGIDDGLGLIYAEALSFALAAQMPRPEAQRIVKELCIEARQTGTALPALAASTWPDQDFTALFTAQAQLGDSSAEADQFWEAAKRI